MKLRVKIVEKLVFQLDAQLRKERDGVRVERMGIMRLLQILIFNS
jgi:hypothetical protein